MNPEDEVNSLYPIAVLIDELKHDDVSLRLNAIRNLTTIASALGVERTREELIPFLDESIDDEDEVLLALAEELGNLIDHVGGPAYAHCLLSPLENLAAVEETVVREKAIESLSKIAQVFSSEQIENQYISLIKRLTNGDWFTSRTSACGLYAPIYKKCQPSTQAELKKLYAQLCKDDTPMVRRAATTNMSKFVKEVSQDSIINEFVPLFKILSKDDQDSVRLLTVEVFVSIFEVLSFENNENLLNEELRGLCTDSSWRVRYMVADNLVKVANVVGQKTIQNELVEYFINFLSDNEPEVRTAASTQISGFCAFISKETILNKILPCLKNLVTDSSQHVRGSLALNIGGLAPLLGKESTIEYLLPLFLQLLKDEIPEVRLNIISKLDLVNKVIGIELLSQSLLPAIVELAEDKQWRVRLAIIEHIPLLASQLGVQFFDEKLGSLCMSWLGDCVYSIREAATANLRKLTDVFGVEWAKTTIIPQIMVFAQHTNYLYRMTMIFAITTLAQALTPEMIAEIIIPTIANLSDDPIPNIRFNVAKSFEQLIPLMKTPQLQKAKEEIVKPTLMKLYEDTDNDVKFFANRALSIVDSV